MNGSSSNTVTTWVNGESFLPTKTKKQRIADLEKRVAELERRISPPWWWGIVPPTPPYQPPSFTWTTNNSLDGTSYAVGTAPAGSIGSVDSSGPKTYISPAGSH